jgi:hypothetical protein
MAEKLTKPTVRAHRNRVLKRGIVAFNNRFSSLECSVRDVSESGCRLKSDAARQIPDTFELHVEVDGLWYPCAVIWRRGDEVGVRFSGAPSVAKSKRRQVVAPSTPAKVSLRRKPT